MLLGVFFLLPDAAWVMFCWVLFFLLPDTAWVMCCWVFFLVDRRSLGNVLLGVFSCCQTQPGRKAGPVTDGGARGGDDGGPEGVLPAASAGFLWGQDRVSVCVCVCVGGGDGGPIPASAGFLWRQDRVSVCVCGGGGDWRPIPASAGLLWRQDRVSVCVCVWGGGVNGGLKAFSLLHLQSPFGDNTGWVFSSSDME